MKKILLFVLFCLFLAACGPATPDPIEVAKARALDAETSAQAEADRIANERSRLALQERQETADDRVAFKENLLWWGSIAACVSVVATAGGYWYFIIYRSGMAFAKRADLQSRIVHISRDTRLAPILVDWEQNKVVNLDTGEVKNLCYAALPDPYRLALTQRTKEIGVLADAAEKIAKHSQRPEPSLVLSGIEQLALQPVIGEDDD